MSGIRILFLTDTHIRGNSPRGRTDNLPETLVSKLKEVAGIAENYNVNAIMHGGDLFDTPGPSLSVSSQFLAIFRQMPAPVYIIAGNHDLFGQNPQTLHRTMLGLAAELGVFRILQPGVPAYLKGGNITVQLTGQHFHYDIDRRDPNLDYVVSEVSADVAIHMVHGMLLDRPVFPGAPCTLLENIAGETKATFTLAGHAHLGFRDFEWEGKFFINPGALVRLSALPQEIKRKPAVLLLDFSTGSSKFKKIFLESALPGEDVLDRAHIEQAEFQKEKLSLLIQGIKSGGDYRITRLEEIINTIAAREGISSGVREEALLRLAKVQEEMGE